MRSHRRALLLLLLLGASALAVWRLDLLELEPRSRTPGSATGEGGPLPRPIPRTPPNRLRLDPRAPHEIELHEMVELDFMTRDQVYKLRQGYVQRHAELIDGRYRPSGEVFGQIVDGRPWWGILGIYFYGRGQRSIEGPSEETRFLANPFLLVGLIEPIAWSMREPPEHPSPFHPAPRGLIWFEGGAPRARVTYAVGDYFDELARKRNDRSRELSLIAYNARDLGLSYLSIDPDRSRNVAALAGAGQVVRIAQFIHVGPSCGYPGGCNNMSPYQRELMMRVGDLPAHLELKLWRDPPRAPRAAADLMYLVELE